MENFHLTYFLISLTISVICCQIAIKKESSYPGSFSPVLILILFFTLYNCLGSAFIKIKNYYYLSYFIYVHLCLIALVLGIIFEEKIFPVNVKYKTIKWLNTKVIPSPLITYIVCLSIIIVVFYLIFSSQMLTQNLLVSLKSFFTFSAIENYSDLRTDFKLNKSYIFYLLSRGIYPLCIMFFVVNYYAKKEHFKFTIAVFLAFLPQLCSLQKSPLALLVAMIIFSYAVIKNVKLNILRLTAIFCLCFTLPVVISILSMGLSNWSDFNFGLFSYSYIERIILINPEIVYENISQALQSNKIYYGGITFANLYKWLGLPNSTTMSEDIYYAIYGYYKGSANSSFISALFWDFRLFFSVVICFIISFGLKYYTNYLLFIKQKTPFIIATYAVLTVSVIKLCLASMGTVLCSEGLISILLLGFMLR